MPSLRPVSLSPGNAAQRPAIAVPPLARCLCTLWLGFGAGSAVAAGLQFQVHDASGNPLPDAVLYAVPESGPQSARNAPLVTIEQNGRKFVPLVTVLQTGSQVSFPNNDTVRHHIYSFSAPKKFEMKLYSGTPGENVLFDKSGSVVLGCNIHDKMIAYIQVVDTPYFAKTDASGQARISSIPPGRYQLRAWHFLQTQSGQNVSHPLQVGAAGDSLQLRISTRSAAPGALRPETKAEARSDNKADNKGDNKAEAGELLF